MKGLLLRLSALDSDAEAAVRVIAYFDRLVERAATPGEVVRATAALAECVVGWASSGNPDAGALRFAPNGAEVGAEVPIQSSASAPVDPSDSASTARVWLERPGTSAPLDDLVLERLALTARLLGSARRRTPAPNLADPALVELVLAEREAREDRARAVHLLGLAAGLPVRVLAVRPAPGRDPIAEAVALVSPARGPRTVRVAAIGEVAAVLLQPPAGADALPPVLRAALAVQDNSSVAALGGAAPPLDARRSWHQAQLALRFAVPGTTDTAFIEHDALGTLALLAELPAQRLRTEPDVLALDALASTRAGALDVAALEAFCRTGSLRQAAAELHLHHSSVAARLARVEQAVGWRLDTPGDRFRARLAVVARLLAGSA
ncbi:MAG: hypothetical protein QOE32_3731 [Pseudonocardiales bacterium]|nr:hypothetical protein [Pseudonocardiales bacterium]